MASTTADRAAQLALLLITLAGLVGLSSTLTGTSAAPAPVSQATELAPIKGCWTEWKKDGTSERLYGELALAAPGSTPLDCEAFGEPAGASGGAHEDDPSWDCRTMGNRVCGEGAEVDGVEVPAGDYSDGDQVAAPVGHCLAELGYGAGPVVRGDAEWCAGQ